MVWKDALEIEGKAASFERVCVLKVVISTFPQFTKVEVSHKYMVSVVGFIEPVCNMLHHGYLVTGRPLGD